VLLTNVLPSSGWGASVQSWISNNLVTPDKLAYVVSYGLLIIGFSYFYTAIAFDPAQQAENIRKQGGFIPGIRPGPQTERYLSRILTRITLPGAIFVAFIALLPSIMLAVADVRRFPFAGTSILIAVGVVLETIKQIDSQMMMRNYEGFLK
jgi:preprotein translocase subunit SecY